jgi:cyclohexa-1,5-dienecarbonyl-CoA hydratase
MPAQYTDILFQIQDGVARITLNRPPLNIMNLRMMEEITQALEALKPREDIKLLVFDHQGKAFSAGADIKDHTPDKVDRLIEVFHGLFRVLGTVGAPSLAMVDGAALGGGCELATFCDLTVASERATFGQPEIKVGVFPPVAAVVLPYLIGRNRTMELLLTGEVVGAAEAAQMGLINRVFPTETFREQVDQYMAKLTSLSASVLKWTKKAVDQALYGTVDAGIAKVERIYLDELMRTEDAQEGLAAFLEKRKPVWKDQ